MGTSLCGIRPEITDHGHESVSKDHFATVAVKGLLDVQSLH